METKQHPMTLEQIKKNYRTAQKELEKQYFEDFSQFVLAVKPDAKTFEFEGYSEYNDEGGSYTVFFSLAIDNKGLEEIVSEMPEEKLKEIFNLKLSDEDFQDKDYIWDHVRDEMYGLPDFVYEKGTIKIKCATA